MKNQIIEPNRNQTNGQVHAKFAASPAVANPTTEPLNEPARNWPTVLPLPQGEGRGEGEGTVHPFRASVPSKAPSNVEPGTLNFETPTRVGKIARLPAEIREYVNELLRAGRTYPQVAAALEKLGHSGISDRNVCNWKHGGFVDWLRERQQAEARLALPKALERCLRSGEIDGIQQNALLFAANNLMLIMSQFDHERAVNLLYHKLELFPKYVAALGSLARCSSDLSKSFDLAQNREATIREQLAAQEPERGIHAASPPDDEDDAPQNSEAPANRMPTISPTAPTPPITPIHPEPPPSPRLDSTTETPPAFQIPELGVERTFAEILNLLKRAKNGDHRKPSEGNGNHRKPTEAKSNQTKPMETETGQQRNEEHNKRHDGTPETNPTDKTFGLTTSDT